MRNIKWFVAFLIVATLFGGILGCKPEVEILSDKTAPADVTELTVQAANGNAVLSWKNPADTDFAGVQISMSPAEGTLKNAVSLGKDVTSLDVSGLIVGKEYTFTVKAFDESLNYSEGKEVKATVVAATGAKITSVSIPVAGTNYAGEVLPVTIIGKDFTAPGVTASGFTSTGATLTNVKIISDTKATAEVACPYAVGTTNVTVSYGVSSAIGTLKVVAAENCFSVGDILFTDGTRIKAENVQYGVPDSQLDKAFAVITSAPYGGAEGKAVGLQRSDYLVWSPSNTIGYSTNFTGIQGTETSGDMDGSDNWEYICSIDPEGTKDPANNYPAFNFALTYGTQAGLTGTDYENGWYVPSVAELYDVYTNNEVVQTSLNAAGGFILKTIYYWSSSQDPFDSKRVAQMWFSNGYDVNVNGDDKCYDNHVFVLQAFYAEQFNNYEYGKPSITCVTVANAGEGYTGELPVTIIGENLKGYEITSNDASFGNVTYLSDTKVIATITCNGVVGEGTITVTSGASSASGTVKVVAAENCFSVGDILFTDGTRIKAENVQCGVPDSQLDKAFAVITFAPYGGGVGKAVGLQRSSDDLKWAPKGTTGYSTNFTKIQSIRRGYSSSGYTFSGDIDGSDNWEYICSIDPEGTKDAATNYPVFNFALTYGTQAGLTGTEYENGWYVPSLAELYDVYTNKEVVQTSLNAAGGFTLGTSKYCSSSQDASYYYSVSVVGFSNGGWYCSGKIVNHCVFVLQAFNAEQFN